MRYGLNLKVSEFCGSKWRNERRNCTPFGWIMLICYDLFRGNKIKANTLIFKCWNSGQLLLFISTMNCRHFPVSWVNRLFYWFARQARSSAAAAEDPSMASQEDPHGKRIEARVFVLICESEGAHAAVRALNGAINSKRRRAGDEFKHFLI